MMHELRSLRPNAVLLIAGEGPAAPSLRAQATRLGLDGSVRFLGYFDRGGELQDCYSETVDILGPWLDCRLAAIVGRD
jgi:1,2-diacylglycerol 3-alpha-glucosyltransferase